MAEPTRQYLFTTQMVRAAFVMSGIGMVAAITGILILATSRPQGRFVAADSSQFEATLAAASEDLEGFERIGESRARIDIETAMQLVAERGVGLPLLALGSELPTAEEAPVAEGEGEGAVSSQAEELPDGEALYSNCSGCHMATGEGIPPAFPPLARHMPTLYNAEGGREYLIAVLLYGLQGEIVIDGTNYNGLMPARPQLSDAQLAAILNHEMTAWGNDALVEEFVPFAAEEFAALRDQGLGMTDVYGLRNELDLP